MAKRATSPRCELSERDETVEYFKTLGLFSGVSLISFFALTAAGLEDIAAGNLVLVGLVCYGAYLLFFDGGVTQAALERQAVQQLADEEGTIMRTAPRFDVGTLQPGDDIAPRMEADGFARVNGVLSPETTRALLAHVNEELPKALQKEGDPARETFGDVLSANNRFDLFLDLAPPVREAVREGLGALKPVFEDALGPGAELFELSALVADPRAERQPIHPDTPYREGQGPTAITAFFALEDVLSDMGPTEVVPQTHTAKAHEEFNSPDDGGRARIQLLRNRPNHIGALKSGDCNLIDSRLLHCGGANESQKRRILFYFSFRSASARSTGSLLYNLRREGLSLAASEEWTAENWSPAAAAVAA